MLTQTQVSRLHKLFAKFSSANIKFSKTQLSKKVQLGEFFVNKMLVPFNPFKIFYSVSNSTELHTEESKKKRLPINKKEAKNFLVDAELNVISKKFKDELAGSGKPPTNNEKKIS